MTHTGEKRSNSVPVNLAAGAIFCGLFDGSFQVSLPLAAISLGEFYDEQNCRSL